MEERYFTERGIAYRINKHSSGRSTLLFLHGLSGSASAWYPYEKELARSFNLIIPDLRGHGYSKRWRHPGDYTFTQFANDIASLIEHLTAGPVTIVAHSFAAVIVRELVRRQQLPIKGVVLLAPAYGVHRLLLTRLVMPFLIALCAGAHFLSIRKGGGRVDYRIFLGCADWDLQRIWKDVSNTGFHSYLWSLRELYRYTDESWRELVPLRTFILHGESDRFVPFSHSVTLARSLPQARLEVLSGANHMLVINEVRKVLAFIRRCCF